MYCSGCFKRLAHQRLRQDQPFGACATFGRAFDHHVIHVPADRQRHIAGQRPGRGRPDQEVGSRLILDRETHKDARIGHVLVALRDFVAAQRRAAARAVGHDLVALVEQPLIPELAQNPPHALDVLVLEGDIGIFQIDPEAHALGEPFPFLDVAQHALAALLVERRDAVFLDLVLVLEAEFLFDLDLHRQAVRIPAALAQHIRAVHGV